MNEEPERPFRLREEWVAALFVGLVLLAGVAGGILLLVGP
jgi:hypothetical protein